MTTTNITLLSVKALAEAVSSGLVSPTDALAVLDSRLARENLSAGKRARTQKARDEIAAHGTAVNAAALTHAAFGAQTGIVTAKPQVTRKRVKAAAAPADMQALAAAFAAFMASRK